MLILVLESMRPVIASTDEAAISAGAGLAMFKPTLALKSVYDTSQRDRSAKARPEEGNSHRHRTKGKKDKVERRGRHTLDMVSFGRADMFKEPMRMFIRRGPVQCGNMKRFDVANANGSGCRRQ